MSTWPPLARWDSVWYRDIAVRGYAGDRNAFGFLPLYPWLMRCVATVLGIDAFAAGLCVSRAATLSCLLMLVAHSRSERPDCPVSRSAAAALLAFPTGFILLSVYSESTYLAFALGTFMAARRGRPALAALAAFAAGLTRIHAIALVPALAVLGWSRRRSGEGWQAALAPLAGVVAALSALSAYYFIVSGDPLLYFSVKRGGPTSSFAFPLETIEGSILRFLRAVPSDRLEALYVGLEPLCLLLAAFCAFRLGERRCWPEATYVAAGLAMSLISGSLWGLPRFLLSLFPVFTVVAAFSRHSTPWWTFLLISTAVQIANLYQFVSFAFPGP